MKKYISLLMVMLLCLIALAGCAQAPTEEVATETTEVTVEEAETVVEEVADEIAENMTVIVAGPKAPPTFPMLRMMDTKALGENIDFELKIWNSVEEMLAIASSQDYGFMGVPVNVSAKLYNKGLGVKLTNVDTWGVMYMYTTDADVRTWQDLKGKKLYVPFKSAPPDIVTQYLLKENGVKAGEDVEIVYSTPFEIAQLMIAGEIDYAMNIEPYVTAVTMQNENVSVLFDYMEEWKKLKGEETMIPNAGIITNNKFFSENEALVAKFEEEYKKATEWVMANPEEAGALCEQYLGVNAALIGKAMPNMGLHYETSAQAKDDLVMYYESLLDFQKESIGGKLPNEDYYYGEN